MRIGRVSIHRQRSPWCHAHRWIPDGWDHAIGHPYDYETELRHWPRWKVRFHVCRLDISKEAIASGTRAWGFWLYCNRGGRRLDLIVRPTERKVSLATRARNAWRTWLSVLRADS